MFIKTVQFNKKTAVAIVAALAVIIIALILLAARGGSSGNHSIFKFSKGVKTNEGRIEYLSALGWEVEETPVDSKSVLIPKEFSEVLKDYNKLQISSGFDLTDYAGLSVEQFTYRVTNYSGVDCEVNATLYIYNNQVIGGDIHSTSIDGFMHGLK